MSLPRLLPPVLVLILSLAGCSSGPSVEEKAAKAPAKEEPEQVVNVKFETTKGDFVVEVHPKWAPIGAERFIELVKDGYYDNSAFYRVVPNYVIQFGIAGEPAMTKKWDKTMKDDFVLRTNARGTVAFAETGAPESRTTQVFVNMRSNQNLDDQSFAPFAKITSGMEVLEKIHAGHGERPEQEKIKKGGNAYLKANFPNLDYIRKATIQ
jgi:cyclophilin family peptidyl-prolyl cis-trans isomerase